jgi:hypothetical protein
LNLSLPLNLSLSRDCVRDFVSGICPIQELKLFSSLRFCEFQPHSIKIGNAFIILLGGILFCKIVGYRHIDAAPITGVYHTFTTSDEITVWANGSFPFRDRVYSKRCIWPWSVPICHDFNMTRIADTFRSAFLAAIPQRHIDDNTVVLSFRGSDIMNPGTDMTNYWQPPCFFYTDVQRRFPRALIVSSDDTNPCVGVSMRKGALFRGTSAFDDFVTLIWAKHVALARSSFPRAAMYLSPVSKDFYVFEGDGFTINSRWNWFMHRYLEHGDHWDCRASPRYRSSIFANWSAHDEQKQFLLTDHCTWERVTMNNRSRNVLPPSQHDIGAGWTVDM